MRFPSPHSPDPPEATPRALVLGVVLGLVMAVANVYLGLFAGMTVSASIPAAVISMGILRGVLRTGTVLENNIVQTIASSGESLAAGVIFTMPALVIAGAWTEFDFTVTTAVAVTGGLLGILFMIPLRRPLIVDDTELAYPEGVACARVLTAGEVGGAGKRSVLAGLGAGAAVKLLADGCQVIGASLQGIVAVGRAHFFPALAAAPALVGVGYVVGPNIATLVFLGGALAWLVAAPLLSLDLPVADAAALHAALRTQVRFLGVGAMMVGGLWSIVGIRAGIVQGVRGTLQGYRLGAAGRAARPRTDTDMDGRALLLLLAATVAVVLWLYRRLTGDLATSLLATGLMTVSAFFFVAVAAHVVGLVGSSNSPVSGMTICSVLLTAAVVALFGYQGEKAIIATLGVAGVVCCAACSSGDISQDLKTGALVGATPWRQQWAEVLGAVTAAFVMQPVLRLLHQGYGIGTEAHLPAALRGHALEAPQAGLFASLVQGFFGTVALPWRIVAVGAALAVATILVDRLVLHPRRLAFRLHVMPLAVGMYLPFGVTTAILLGGVLTALTPPGGRDRGVLLASGLIAGEAIAGVLVAVPRAAEVRLPVLLSAGPLRSALTVLVLVLISGWLLRAPRTGEDRPSQRVDAP
jgi:putative OPT family oligopeptide transporter